MISSPICPAPLPSTPTLENVPPLWEILYGGWMTACVGDSLEGEWQDMECYFFATDQAEALRLAQSRPELRRGYKIIQIQQVPRSCELETSWEGIEF